MAGNGRLVHSLAPPSRRREHAQQPTALFWLFLAVRLRVPVPALCVSQRPCIQPEHRSLSTVASPYITRRDKRFEGNDIFCIGF